MKLRIVIKHTLLNKVCTPLVSSCYLVPALTHILLNPICTLAISVCFLCLSLYHCFSLTLETSVLNDYFFEWHFSVYIISPNLYSYICIYFYTHIFLYKCHHTLHLLISGLLASTADNCGRTPHTVVEVFFFCVCM